MSGLLIGLIYLTCLIIGFGGGIFGHFFAKHLEKKKHDKEPELINVKC